MISKPAPEGSGEDPSIAPLNDAERTWLAEQLTRLAKVGVDVDDLASLGHLYDEQLHEWLATPPPDRADPNDLINRLGSGLGEHIRRHTDLTWVVAADQFGTEIALHRGDGNVLVYPANMVAKRWVAGELGALARLGQATVEAVHSIPRETRRPD